MIMSMVIMMTSVAVAVVPALMMVACGAGIGAGGQESGRALSHLVEAFKLADAAGLIRDPDLAASRLGDVLRVHGVAA